MFEEKMNKHPKYGSKIESRNSNGFYRAKKRQQKLEKKFKTKSKKLWTSGVYFDENKNRLEWFCNLWHRKFWKKTANHRVRRKKEFLQNGGYKKFFYMVMNCDRVRLRSWNYESENF